MPEEHPTEQIWIALTVYAVVRLHRAHMNNQQRRTAMTDDSVIEEAAKAMLNNEHPEAEWWGVAEIVQNRWRDRARSAFAVFEKAQGEPSDAQQEYRCVIEGWKGSPENTFREPTMWTTRQSAERTYEWQHARIGEEVAHDFQPHITAVFMSRRIKAGEPERVKGESSEDAALRSAGAVGQEGSSDG